MKKNKIERAYNNLKLNIKELRKVTSYFVSVNILIIVNFVTLLNK
jgi:hypothetical protein